MFTIFINALAFLIFGSFINLSINCQQATNHTLIEINKVYNGSLTNDYTYSYYKLIIPEGIEKNTKNLVFKVKEPDTSFSGVDDFSDPDIYVSTVIF